MRWALRFLIFGLLFSLAAQNAGAQEVYRIRLDEPIHSVTKDYVIRALDEANAAEADLILLEIDTPGGYVISVEEIQRVILESDVPIIGFVRPMGGRAASGGAMVALACDLIAMAPGTTIGAAHPISMIPIPKAPPKPEVPRGKGDQENPDAEPASDAVQDMAMKKLVNDLAAHMRSIAENRGRNPQVAEAMVREAISLTEREALEAGVIELIAKDWEAVFTYLEENPVKRFTGEEVNLDLGPAPTIRDLEMTRREKFLTGLASPHLTIILLLLGALGLYIEFKSPGLIFPGVLGGIFILLFVMSTPILPVNIVGLLLVLLAIVFFILEIKVVSYGILSVGGLISLVIGGMMMYKEGPIPELRLPLEMILPIAVAFAAVFIFLIFLAVKALQTPVSTGVEGMVGQIGTVRAAIAPSENGKVFVFGELWEAESSTPLDVGTQVRVAEVRGMTLVVEAHRQT